MIVKVYRARGISAFWPTDAEFPNPGFPTSPSGTKMSLPSSFRIPFLATVAGIVIVSQVGCSSLSVPNFETPKLEMPRVDLLPSSGESPYKGVDQSELVGSRSAEIYQKIKEAKNQNSIVLQVVGDSEPFRVLPLPPKGKTIFVSELFEQTGLQRKYSRRMRAMLYRPSPESLNGIRMEIHMDRSGDKVAASCDYALRPGDRIEVSKDTTSSMQQIVNFALRR